MHLIPRIKCGHFASIAEANTAGDPSFEGFAFYLRVAARQPNPRWENTGKGRASELKPEFQRGLRTLPHGRLVDFVA